MEPESRSEAVHSAIHGARQCQRRFRARHSHVAQAALFLEFFVVVLRSAVRKNSFLHAGQKHVLEFQAFGAMQSHERDLRVFVKVIGIADQCGVIQKIGKRFATLGTLGHGVDQFAQVVGARGVLDVVALQQHVQISAARQHGLQKIRGRGGRHFLLQCFNQRAEIAQRSERASRQRRIERLAKRGP